MQSNHFILYHPLLLLPSIFPSIRVFPNESALHVRWPKYWSFSFISPSNEHPGLVSFRMDWLDLLAAQGTLKSLLWYHSSKTSVLHCSAFFPVQLSHLYMTTGKTIGLIIRSFASKVSSLLSDTLSRFVKGFPGGSDGKQSAGSVDPLEDSLEMGMSPLQYPYLEILWTEEPGRPQSIESPRVRRTEATGRALCVTAFLQRAEVF